MPICIEGWIVSLSASLGINPSNNLDLRFCPDSVCRRPTGHESTTRTAVVLRRQIGYAVVGVRVGADELREFDVEAGFFLDFADGGVSDALAEIMTCHQGGATSHFDLMNEQHV